MIPAAEKTLSLGKEVAEIASSLRTKAAKQAYGSAISFATAKDLHLAQSVFHGLAYF